MMSLLMMVDKELEDFENERDKHKGLKSLVNFNTNLTEYSGSNASIEIKPVFKKKLTVSIYRKEDKSKGQLF